MKTVLVAALLAVCTSASAQFTNSKSSSSSNTEGWSTFYLQYNPGHIKADGGGSISFNGFSVGYNKAMSISSSSPLFIEAGIGLQYSSHSENYEDYYEDYKETVSLVSLKVPVSIVYNYAIPNSDISIAPYAGIYLRGNVIGKYKYTNDDDESESYDLFSDDDMEGNTWKRFQIGWHVGANAKFNNKFLVGVSYGADLSDIAQNCKTNQLSITLGLIF